MKVLDKVTIVIIDCQDPGRAINAIQKTLQQITPAQTLFFTDVDIKVPNVYTVVIPKITSNISIILFFINFKFICYTI